MAGPNITEDLPLNIGNPGTSGFWTNNAEDYDVAFGGIPFFIAPTDVNPYQRETAPYRKEQFDNSKEPGEQSLTGWWIRSQSSFHGGTGINFYDPSAGESIGYRFNDSQNVNIWTKGQVTLLNSVIENHNTTATLDSYNRPQQHIRSIQWTLSGTTYNGILLHDGYDIDKCDSAGNVTHFVDYNSGSAEPVYAVCDDGVYAYWVTNATQGGANKMHMYKKPLTGSSANTADEVTMFYATGTVITNAVMEYVKDRIVLCVNGKVYEIAPNATSLGTAVYTNPNPNYIYTSITASGPAIYTSGNSGMYSTIQKYTLGTNGSMPTLTQASVAAEFPPGEVVYKIFYYLGYMAIGTSSGVRIAEVSDQDGSIAYGPLTIELTAQPCYDFAASDRFLWCATGDGSINAGLNRVDLSQIVEGEPLRFAYASDLRYDQTTSHKTVGCAFFGNTARMGFVTAFDSTSGHVYREDTSVLASSGYVTTGAIRYGTLEPKNYKFIRARGDYSYGSMDIQSIDSASATYNIITYNFSVGTPEAATTNPEGPQEFLSYKFTLSRSASDTSRGPIFKGYQAKALPATKRQRLIQFPVWCYDIEKDRYNVQTGYEGRAWERIQILEDIEAAGDIVNVQDFTTGERIQAIIERIDFSRKTPPNGNFDGFGGLLLVTVRSVL